LRVRCNKWKKEQSSLEEIVKKETPEEIQKPPQAQDLAHPGSSQIPETLTSKIALKVDEKKIKIDTPLYKAIFTNVGPTIRSFELKNYLKTTDPDSPLIELVSFKKDIGDFLLINFEESSINQNKTITYRVDQETIRLGPESSPKELVFSSKTSNGL
jgi:YidC/Oxa1 family membrane protein insertase